MFKRANKVTALLVAAASIMSIVPAMATTRLGTKDGHITGGAIAFADGKYVYDGYRTDEDDNGIYYNDGTDAKEKLNDDLRDYELSGKYGTKYAYATDNNGKDQYLIDLSTGKVVDDETPEDKADSVKSKLKATLKKTDRYAATGTWDSVDLGDSAESERYVDNTRILPRQFGDVWYMYSAGGDKTATPTNIGQTATKASFSIKLPTNEGTTQFTVGNLAPISRLANETLDAFKTRITNTIKANIANTAQFNAIWDINTITNNATTITGQAKTVGEIAVTDANLIAFAQVYTPGVSLAAASVDTITTTNGALQLGTLASAISSDQTVATSITAGNTVAISRAGITGTATITVKDTASNVATLNVKVTTPAGLEVTKVTKFWSATQVQDALIAITSGTATTFADFDAAGVSDLVSENAVDSKKLTVSEAKLAIANYIATGKLGAAVTGTLNQDTVRLVLKAAFDTKVQNISASQIVTINRGQSAVTATLGDPSRYIGFVNESGKYVDASGTANIYIYSKVEGKTVRIKEFNKRDSDYGITVGIQNIATLAQDKDYIYTLTTIGVLEDKVDTKNPNPQVETQYFIQKIAKAQGDKKDGAYLPKTVDSYQVDNKSIYDDGDAQVAYNFLVKGEEDGFTFNAIRVIDGSLYITGAKADGDNDKVKVFKIALKKAKKDLVSGVSTGKKDGKDVDVYIARKDGDSDIDIKKDTRDTAISYDVDGNTWVISKGTITKFSGTEKKDMFTTDRSFTHIDVYNEKSLIAWDTDTDVYTTVGEGTKVTEGEATAVAPVIVTGWVQAADGTWTFNDTTGVKVVAKWINVGGVWYYMKADGVMATGWYQDGATWYFLATSGAMQTGWLNDNGTWYYLNGSGAMLANTTVDGYVLGASGAWVK